MIDYGSLHLLPIKCCNILTSRIYYYKMLVTKRLPSTWSSGVVASGSESLRLGESDGVKPEDRGQRTEDRASGDRRQRTEDGRQRTEDGGQMTEDRGRQKKDYHENNKARKHEKVFGQD